MAARFSVRRLTIAIGICLLVSGCRARTEDVVPIIHFTTIPEAAVGGAERTAAIAGRVTGARPGQHIVLFARTNMWWVQPFAAQPFTAIESDSTWKSTIHLGLEYSALLVDAGYSPPHTAQSLPGPGGGVIAVATVKGTGEPPALPSSSPARPRDVLTFSGYEWQARAIPSDRGGLNDYAPENVWTDADGFLHLKLARRGDRWTSAEVILTRALGYGTYTFTVRDVSGLDPAAVFGMLTWDEDRAAPNHRELDIEISQWGDLSIPNGQYVLQPFYVPANVARFAAPAGRLTHTIRWEPGRALFRTVRGSQSTSGALVAQHEFRSGVPTPGSEHVRMNLYFFRYAPMALKKDVEVVVERFQYLP
jgi:hypothetical protein